MPRKSSPRTRPPLDPKQLINQLRAAWLKDMREQAKAAGDLILDESSTSERSPD
jgi:hypothetical protein